LILTARVINPYKALFRIENWLEAVVNRIKPFVRDYTTTASYAELIKDAARIGTEIYKRLEEENLLPEFRGDYGVDVKKIEVKSINPPKEYREVTLLKYVAERELEKVVVGANAEKQRIEIVAEGEKARIETVYKAVEKFGDLGQLIRTLEALEQSPLAASVTVQAIPGVQEMLRGVFGKPLETVTPEEFKDLKEKVEKIDKLSKKGR
jgi:regulator of protease activity HflC (stomatin/prohibitin superfamily)